MPPTIFCSGCGEEILSHLVNCPVCATPLPRTEPEQRPTSQNRPVAPPPSRQGYQPPYGWMDTNETPNGVIPTTPAQPAYQSPPATAPGMLPCPSCGKLVPRTHAFCSQCGRPLQAASLQQQYQPPPAVYYPVAQPPVQRTVSDNTLVIIIAIIAALVILGFFC